MASRYNAVTTPLQQNANETITKVSNVKVSKEKERKENYLLNINISSASFFSWMDTEFKITTKRERCTFTKYAKLYAAMCSLDKSFNGRMNGKLADMKEQAKGDKLALNKMFITSINKEVENIKCL